MSQGLGLLDIAPQSEDIALGNDKFLKVSGISFADIVTLLQRFPDAQTWIAGAKLDPDRLLKIGPDAVAAIIAAAAGLIGDKKAEEVASKLGVETQLDALEAIGRLTFRSGFGPFVQRIAGLVSLARAVSASSGKGPDTNSPQPSTPSQPSGAGPTPSGA